MKKIVVLTSGGDAPGMNAAIRAVVRTAIYKGLEVYGSESGYLGLVKQKLRPLNMRSVANCIQRGGTILKTGRVQEFYDPSVRQQCNDYLKQLHIDGLIVIGGDGSFRGAALLAEEGGPRVIGIPCTIDNDIVGTDYCIGFDTARNTALEAIDKIRDTAFSLERNFLIEVMGRSSGFLAVDVGIAGGAEIIVTPEFPLSLDQLTQKIKENSNKKLASIIVVAEADNPGRSFTLAKNLKEKTGIIYKVCVLGHVQRGGTPTVQDRKIGSIMGAKAVKALLDNHTHKMIALQHGEFIVTPFPDPDHATRFFTDEKLLAMNEIICDMKDPNIK